MTSLPTRALGVVRAPRTTLAGVVTQPVWADVLFFTTIVVFACNALFLSTGVGQLALLDQWEQWVRTTKRLDLTSAA